ncbi:hypothetical protein C0991_001345 [Blastosporella zonata]|nr:hypothetical protein C0991_001345 [Blastosporella zonata]
MNRLRSLHIDVPPHPVWNVSTFHLPESIPWTQLTSLTLVAVDNKTRLVLDDTLRVLVSCSNLEQCRLEILIDDRQSTHPPISLPRLTSLNFHAQIIDSPSASFLDFLVTPALVALHPTPFDPAATLSLIHRSGCILRKLKVPYTSERRNLSESELEKLHSLLELQAGNMFFDDSTITKIAEGILLPEMDTLSLSPRSMDEIDSFQRLVEGRWKASSRGLNETTEAEGDEPPTPTPRALRQLRVVLGGFLAFQDKAWAPSRFRQFGAYKTGVRVELVPQVMDALHGTIVYASEDWTDE